jgi:hypothetical protein
MGRHLINLFMWGYQPHFRIMLESTAKNIFKQLDIDTEPKVLLVGVLAPSGKNVNPVCVEPENEEWPLVLFDNLHTSIEEIIANHDLQNMCYSDEQSMREKPEVIHCDSVSRAVREALLPYDLEHAVYSFCGKACLVGEYYVVPIIQIQNSLFQQFPPLKEVPTTDHRTWRGPRSLIHACMSALLKEAISELKRPEPGRSLLDGMKRPDELVRDGATNFMLTPGAAVTDRYLYTDLFARFNLISSMMYEGLKGSGRLILVSPDNSLINYMLRFEVPIPLNEPRWTRKILQMATNEIALIADAEKIYGLGRLVEGYDFSLQDAFVIDFLDHYHWELRLDHQTLLRSKYGDPKLPQGLISEVRFKVNYSRLFPTSNTDDQNLLWALFDAASQLSHGCMIIVAEDALEEVERLKQQGTAIKPTLMSVELLYRVSGIDGTIILDPHGVCYAVGVILDGPAAPECTPSRGSRYNSAVRYTAAGNKKRMAIVVSDDHTVDFFPLTPPMIQKAELEFNISKIESATLNNYHKPRNWLDKHRFYLDALQCNRVNAALDRIEKLPRDVGEIMIVTKRFLPNEALDNTYFI